MIKFLNTFPQLLVKMLGTPTGLGNKCSKKHGRLKKNKKTNTQAFELNEKRKIT